jgi:hypothetical protein
LSRGKGGLGRTPLPHNRAEESTNESELRGSRSRSTIESSRSRIGRRIEADKVRNLEIGVVDEGDRHFTTFP